MTAGPAAMNPSSSAAWRASGLAAIQFSQRRHIPGGRPGSVPATGLSGAWAGLRRRGGRASRSAGRWLGVLGVVDGGGVGGPAHGAAIAFAARSVSSAVDSAAATEPPHVTGVVAPAWRDDSGQCFPLPGAAAGADYQSLMIIGRPAGGLPQEAGSSPGLIRAVAGENGDLCRAHLGILANHDGPAGEQGAGRGPWRLAHFLSVMSRRLPRAGEGVPSCCYGIAFQGGAMSYARQLLDTYPGLHQRRSRRAWPPPSMRSATAPRPAPPSVPTPT